MGRLLSCCPTAALFPVPAFPVILPGEDSCRDSSRFVVLPALSFPHSGDFAIESAAFAVRPSRALRESRFCIPSLRRPCHQTCGVCRPSFAGKLLSHSVPPATLPSNLLRFCHLPSVLCGFCGKVAFAFCSLGDSTFRVSGVSSTLAGSGKFGCKAGAGYFFSILLASISCLTMPVIKSPNASSVIWPLSPSPCARTETSPSASSFSPTIKR